MSTLHKASHHTSATPLKTAVVVLATTLSLFFSGHVQSQTAASSYPNQPIRLIVPFAAAGSVDIVARIVGKGLSESLKTSVVVDNRPGANGTIGCDIAAKAAPDGYTIVMGDVGCLAMAPGLYPKLPYDPLKNFAPIALVARTPLLLTVSTTNPVKSMSELLEQARNKPGGLNYPSSGSGGPNHLAGELLEMKAKFSAVHIPYRGGAPAVLSLATGETDFGLLSSVTINALLSAGRVRPLAVANKHRLATMPNVPTMAEEGLPGFEAETWFMAAVPAGTPRAIVERLNAEIMKMLPQPEAHEKLAAMGAFFAPNSPQDATTFLRSEVDKWTGVVKSANIKLEQTVN